ncbi:MAG: YceD family protein [Woeseiaceae bacterium]
MANPIFDRYLPKELAERVQDIDFAGKISDFPRVCEIIVAELEAVAEAERPRQWRAAPVDIRLAFSWLAGHTEMLAVDGRAAATITAVCQRCLAVFDFEVVTEIRMVLVSATADSPPQERVADYEIWDLDEGGVRPIELIEESLVMALPFAPMHESGDVCAAPDGSVSSVVKDTVRPFADLRAKMDNRDN